MACHSWDYLCCCVMSLSFYKRNEQGLTWPFVMRIFFFWAHSWQYHFIFCKSFLLHTTYKTEAFNTHHQSKWEWIQSSLVFLMTPMSSELFGFSYLFPPLHFILLAPIFFLLLLSLYFFFLLAVGSVLLESIKKPTFLTFKSRVMETMDLQYWDFVLLQL